jgi:serralysin
VVSFAEGIRGGYTIANGVMIENATGGSGDDVLIGNDGDNTLTGNDGADVLMGRDGNDLMIGGLGPDTFVIEADDTSAAMPVDVVADLGVGDVVDLSGIDANPFLDGDQAFTETNSAKPGTGEISIRTFGNLNAAENALGIDIATPDDYVKGKVTVILGDYDGVAGADFAVVLLGVKGIDESALMM